jgi:hypothetical protein
MLLSVMVPVHEMSTTTSEIFQDAGKRKDQCYFNLACVRGERELPRRVAQVQAHNVLSIPFSYDVPALHPYLRLQRPK